MFCKIAKLQRKQTSHLFQNRCIELSIQKSTILSLLLSSNDIFHKIDTPYCILYMLSSYIGRRGQPRGLVEIKALRYI